MSLETPQRLAIAISGAVSLGSYEAGVVIEVLRAIDHHNANFSHDRGSQIEIDVITGASAGAMTAVILAQKLLFNATALAPEGPNALFQAWVDEVDIENLISAAHGDDFSFSLLSSNFIQKIAKKYLLDLDQLSSPKPHSGAASKIKVGLAMSNLNGHDYKVQFKDSDYEHTGESFNFIHTRFQDRYFCEIDSTLDQWCDTLAWEHLARCAMSSGAFPLAFRPYGIERDFNEPAYLSDHDEMVPFHRHTNTYVDGGVFNNSPLGMAKRLANEVDARDRFDKRKRFYLYISPEAKSSSINSALKPENAHLLKVPFVLAAAIFGQARFQDWITTYSINDQVREFDDRAAALMAVMNSQNADYFQQASLVLLDTIYSNDSARRKQHLDDLKCEFSREFSSLLATHDAITAEAWLNTVLVLENLSGLVGRDHMKIYSIFAKSSELAGDELHFFGGFLDHSYRQHDYDLGRHKAYEQLRYWSAKAAIAGSGEIFITCPPQAPQMGNYREGIVNERVSDLAPELRLRLYQHLLKSYKLVSKSVTGGVFGGLVKYVIQYSLSYYLKRALDLKGVWRVRSK